MRLVPALQLATGLFGAAVLTAPNAPACGVGAGGGSGVYACSIEEHAEATRLKFRAGAGYGVALTRLVFDDGARVDQQRHTVVATLDHRPTGAITLQLGVGALVGGSLAPRSGASPEAMAPGPLAVVGASWRALDARGLRPFVLLSTQLAAVATTTGEAARRVGYTAFDLRVGIAAGIPIARVLTPYVVARAFGGPIAWRIAGASVTGTDGYHVQLGAGLSAVALRRLDVFVEGVPLGERGISAGVGVSL